MTAAGMLIRPASLKDARAFASHLVEHVGESGKDGSVHFAMARRISREEVEDAAVARWCRRLDEPLWSRAWLLFTDPPLPRVVGHLELKGHRFPAEAHRATLGMGIQRSYTGQGWGQRLIEASTKWAREEAGLSWLDLGVFSFNEPARHLYAKMGFVEVGRVPDRFRLDSGISVEDVQMALALDPKRPSVPPRSI